MSLLIVRGTGSGPARQSPSLWKNYDVTLTLNQDGTFHVVERQVVDFTGGPFTYAFADIPLGRVDEITNVKVSEERTGRVVEYERSRAVAQKHIPSRKSIPCCR